MRTKKKVVSAEVTVISTPIETVAVTEIHQKESLSVESFISKAIESNASIETMERLLAMRSQLKEEQAREAYTGAMSKFQSECPIIVKDKQVMNKDGQSVRYKYAPLDSIVKQVRDALGNNNLSYSFETSDANGFLSATCKVTHILGYSQTSTFQVPIDKEGFMTAPQKYASALTFAKRYAFCNALGILTGDEDKDAVDADVDQTPALTIEEWRSKLDEATSLQELQKVWSSIPPQAHAKKELADHKDFLKTTF